jgi:hypothetical protein
MFEKNDQLVKMLEELRATKEFAEMNLMDKDFRVRPRI